MNVHVELLFMMLVQLYLRLLGGLAPYWKLCSLATCSMLTIAAALAMLPLLIQQILIHLFVHPNQSLVQNTMLAVVLLFMVRGVASYAHIYFLSKIRGQLAISVRKDIFNKLLTLPTSCYSRLTASNDINTLLVNVNQLIHNSIHHITHLIQDILIIVGLIFCILSLNQEFLFLLLLVLPLIVILLQITHNFINKPDPKCSSAFGQLSQRIALCIEHFREIRLGGGQAHECQRLDKMSQSIYRAEAKRGVVQAFVISVGQFITALILIAVSYFVTQQIFSSNLSLDEMGALIAAALILIHPIQRMTKIPKQFQQDQESIETLYLFLDQTPALDTGTQSIDQVDGKLVFESVSLRNSIEANSFLLNHLNLTIRPGEIIAFTNYTENEKNAFIDLILRFQQPTSGRILLDNHPLTNIQLNNLYANLSIIYGHNNFLLDESVAGNIAYGAMRCTNEARITHAAQTSHAMKFIREMSEGLQSKITQNHSKKNKIQLQYLAIARALLKNAPILILDEVAIDPDSDELLSTLEALMENRTTLIFSQRKLHWKMIDKTFSLRNGCLTEDIETGKPLLNVSEVANTR